MFGLKNKDEFIIKRPSSFSPICQPDGRRSNQISQQYIQEAFTKGEPINFEWLHQRKNKEIFPAEVTLTTYNLQNQRVIHGNIRDITERREAEKKIRISEEKYRSLIDQSMEMIYLHDLKGHIIETNSAAERGTGYSQEEMLQLNVFQLHPQEDKQKEICEEWKRWLVGHSVTLEGEHKRKDGSIFPVKINTGKIIIGGKELILAFVHDITSHKKQEEKLTDYLGRLEDLNQVLNQELEKARFIHHKVLPLDLPIIKDISLASYYEPAQKMGGDFYDVITVHNKLVIYLSDVSGHGLDGSLLSLFIKHTIKGYLIFMKKEEVTPSQILEYLASEFYHANYPERYFICIFLAVIDLETKEMTYTGAGFQDTPFVQTKDQERFTLHSHGLFLSSYLPLEILNLKEKSLFLQPQTTIFFNTDGLTEHSVDGISYRERLPIVFYQNAHLSPEAIAQSVQKDFQVFNHGSLQGNDDITFLILKVLPLI